MKPTVAGLLTVPHSKDGLLVLPAYVRLGLKYFKWTNTPAFCRSFGDAEREVFSTFPPVWPFSLITILSPSYLSGPSNAAFN